VGQACPVHLNEVKVVRGPVSPTNPDPRL